MVSIIHIDLSMWKGKLPRPGFPPLTHFLTSCISRLEVTGDKVGSGLSILAVLQVSSSNNKRTGADAVARTAKDLAALLGNTLETLRLDYSSC